MSKSKIDSTILNLAHRYSDAGDLLRAIRKAHPDVSKKDIIHALLETMIAAAGSDDGLARKLHQAAMDNRGGDLA